MNIDCELSEH